MSEVELSPFRHIPPEQLRIASIASRLSTAENAFRTWLMAYTIDRGIPFNPVSAAAESPRGIDSALLLERLQAKRAIVVDPQGNVNFIYPVSALPTHHRVHLEDGRTFCAMCAIDALGSAFTFKQDIRVESQCSECGEPIRVEVTGGRITALLPETLRALHVDLNRVENWAGSC